MTPLYWYYLNCRMWIHIFVFYVCTLVTNTMFVWIKTAYLRLSRSAMLLTHSIRQIWNSSHSALDMELLWRDALGWIQWGAWRPSEQTLGTPLSSQDASQRLPFWRSSGAGVQLGRQRATTPLSVGTGQTYKTSDRRERMRAREDPPSYLREGEERAGRRNRRECQNMCQVGTMWEWSWQAPLLSPSCPTWNTWYVGSGIWPRWLSAAALCLRQLGRLALPLHQLPVDPPGRGGGDELFRAAAANLTSIQEMQHCKHMTISRHPHTNHHGRDHCVWAVPKLTGICLLGQWFILGERQRYSFFSCWEKLLMLSKASWGFCCTKRTKMHSIFC